MNTEKRKELVQRVMGKHSEPTIDALNYNSTFGDALNYYNINAADSEKKKWLLSHISKQDKALATTINGVHERKLRHLGIIARLISRNQYISEDHLKFFTKELNDVKNSVIQPKVESTSSITISKKTTPTIPSVNPQEKALQTARDLAGEFEGLVDEFLLNGTTVDVKEFLSKSNIPTASIKILGSAFSKKIEELKAVVAGKDKQLVEGYSNLKKTTIKNLLSTYESLVEVCGQHSVVKKTTRKQSVRKEKPASVVVSELKYKKEDTTYNIKSISATSIVNAKELWVFNTKYRKLQVYRSNDPKGLSVKGTTLLGWDVDNSSSKTLRKPELVSSYSKMGKRDINSNFKSLKTTESSVNGRVNEDCVLLAVF